MSTTKHQRRAARRNRASQRGAFAVEFGLLIVLFLTMVFAVIEMARLVYMFNTLQEVTRSAARAASTTNFRDLSAMDGVRQKAIFRASPGPLMLGDPITDSHVRIDYMALVRDGSGALTLTPIAQSALPSCPARNRFICTNDPNSANCIRFVRVRVCTPGNGGACDPVPYEPVVPLLSLTPLTLPTSTTIVEAETLGYRPGQQACP